MAAAPGRRGALQGSEVECTKLLESLFRYDAFRSQQWGIIEALDRDEDCLVLMATGGGKSLLYQFLSIARSAVESGGDAAAFEARRGTTLVVAPLISLGPIRQCGLLKELGVRTVVLDGLAFDSPAGLDVATGAFDVLFASPDALPQWLPRLQALNASGLLDLIAIDEGQWEWHWRRHSVRPSSPDNLSRSPSSQRIARPHQATATVGSMQRWGSCVVSSRTSRSLPSHPLRRARSWLICPRGWRW